MMNRGSSHVSHRRIVSRHFLGERDSSEAAAVKGVTVLGLHEATPILFLSDLDPSSLHFQSDEEESLKDRSWVASPSLLVKVTDACCGSSSRALHEGEDRRRAAAAATPTVAARPTAEMDVACVGLVAQYLLMREDTMLAAARRSPNTKNEREETRAKGREEMAEEIKIGFLPNRLGMTCPPSTLLQKALLSGGKADWETLRVAFSNLRMTAPQQQQQFDTHVPPTAAPDRAAAVQQWVDLLKSLAVTIPTGYERFEPVTLLPRRLAVYTNSARRSALLENSIAVIPTSRLLDFFLPLAQVDLVNHVGVSAAVAVALHSTHAGGSRGNEQRTAFAVMEAEDALAARCFVHEAFLSHDNNIMEFFRREVEDEGAGDYVNERPPFLPSSPRMEGGAGCGGAGGTTRKGPSQLQHAANPYVFPRAWLDLVAHGQAAAQRGWWSAVDYPLSGRAAVHPVSLLTPSAIDVVVLPLSPLQVLRLLEEKLQRSAQYVERLSLIRGDHEQRLDIPPQQETMNSQLNEASQQQDALKNTNPTDPIKAGKLQSHSLPDEPTTTTTTATTTITPEDVVVAVTFLAASLSERHEHEPLLLLFSQCSAVEQTSLQHLTEGQQQPQRHRQGKNLPRLPFVGCLSDPTELYHDRQQRKKTAKQFPSAATPHTSNVLRSLHLSWTETMELTDMAVA